MKCPQCKLVEMIIDKVENNNVTHKCKKCGKEITVQEKKDIGKED